MTNTDFKLQLPLAPTVVSASSIVGSHGGSSRAASTAQDQRGRHVERAPIAEYSQFIPPDLEKQADATLSVERVVQTKMRKHIDEGGGTEDALRSGDWRLLAERASREMDSDKLMSLVEELNRVLEESQRKRPSE